MISKLFATFAIIFVVGLLCLNFTVATTTADANLLKNGGFDLGNTSHWNCSGNGVDSAGPPLFGGYELDGAAVGAPAPCSQTVSTVSGASYEISFYASTDSGSSGTGMEILVFWNRDMTLNWTSTRVCAPNNGDYTLFGPYTVTGPGHDTLTIKILNDPSSTYVDNICLLSVESGGCCVFENCSMYFHRTHLVLFIIICCCAVSYCWMMLLCCDDDDDRYLLFSLLSDYTTVISGRESFVEDICKVDIHFIFALSWARFSLSTAVVSLCVHLREQRIERLDSLGAFRQILQILKEAIFLLEKEHPLKFHPVII